jgi:hypothetical protein
VLLAEEPDGLRARGGREGGVSGGGGAVVRDQRDDRGHFLERLGQRRGAAQELRGDSPEVLQRGSLLWGDYKTLAAYRHRGGTDAL